MQFHAIIFSKNQKQFSLTSQPYDNILITPQIPPGGESCYYFRASGPGKSAETSDQSNFKRAMIIPRLKLVGKILDIIY